MTRATGHRKGHSVLDKPLWYLRTLYRAKCKFIYVRILRTTQALSRTSSINEITGISPWPACRMTWVPPPFSPWSRAITTEAPQDAWPVKCERGHHPGGRYLVVHRKGTATGGRIVLRQRVRCQVLSGYPKGIDSVYPRTSPFCATHRSLSHVAYGAHLQLTPV